MISKIGGCSDKCKMTTNPIGVYIPGGSSEIGSLDGGVETGRENLEKLKKENSFF
jgi:hypothetical protein